MHSMRALTIVAVAAGAAAEASQQGHVVKHARAPVVALRGDCNDLPKLCTDPVLLRGLETTLTYLCPETTGPSTITVTTTRTTTVTEDLTSSVPAMATSNSQTPVVEEPTTTETVKSTTQVTITQFVTRAAASVTSLPPPIITWSFTAIPPNVVSAPVSPIKALASSATSLPPPIITWSFTAIPPKVVSAPVSSIKALTSSATSLPPPIITWSFTAVPPNVGAAPMSSPTSSVELFPSDGVMNSSSIASTSAAALPSLGIHRPIFWNHTGIHDIVDHPTLNVVRDTEVNSTKTATTTAAIATESKKGQAGDTQASSIALFFGVLAATLLI